MRFSLIPREMKFFDWFDEVAAILTRASTGFLDMVSQWQRLAEHSAEIRRDEHACDEIVERIITFRSTVERNEFRSTCLRGRLIRKLAWTHYPACGSTASIRGTGGSE